MAKCTLLFFLLVLAQAAAARRISLRQRSYPIYRQYELNVTYGLWAADCVQKPTILINGKFPGPVLVANEGEYFKIKVNNWIHSGAISIHWHGNRMYGNNYNDGTSFVTQCPIGPLDSLVYTFLAERAGTYMYHGHIGLTKTAGLFGQMIVNDKKLPVPYDASLNLLLTDWWHASAEELAIIMDSGGFPGSPQSILLNGKGKYNCSLVPAGYDPLVSDVKTCNASSTQCRREVFTVEYGKTYRLRIAQIASYVGLNVVIEKHGMTVVMADTFLVQPFKPGAEGLDVHSGQTVDVIFKADQPPGNYWIRVAPFSLVMVSPPGLAILNYKGVPAADPITVPPAMRPFMDASAAYNQTLTYKALRGSTPAPPQTSTKELFLVASLGFGFNGLPNLAINNISLVFPSTPFALGIASGLGSIYALPKSGSPPPQASYYQLLPWLAVVDIVLQNERNFIPGSEFHPWHMHGHDFWVLGMGPGWFNATSDRKKFNLVDPPYRNTAAVPAQGWLALRFIANNPGAWLFHCHLEFHQHFGMSIVFVDGGVRPLPAGIRKCGLLS